MYTPISIYTKHIFLLIVISLVSLSALKAQIPTDFTFYSSFNSGLIVQSSNSYSATSVGATLTANRFGAENSAFSFDGINDRISTNYPAAYPNAVSLWFKTNSTSGTLMSWGSSSGGVGAYPIIFHLNATTDGLVLITQVGDPVNTTEIPNPSDPFASGFNDGEWHHLVLNRSSSSPFVTNAYVDNIFTAELQYGQSNGSSGFLNFGAQAPEFGSDPYFSFFNGELDDVRLYDNELSSNEITALYNEGTVASYTFDNNVFDNSGNGNNGTNLGAVFVDDRFGNTLSALSFDGIDDFVEVPSISGSTFFSASFWFNNQNSLNTGFVTLLEISDDSPFIGIENGFLGLFGGAKDPSPISVNEWTHAVVTYDGTTGESILYINGSEVSRTTEVITNAGSGLYIGGGSGDGFFNGVIDDIIIYNSVISSDIVQTIYGENGWAETLVADFTFSGSANDESFFQNSGVINGTGALLVENRFGQTNEAFSFDGSSFIAYPNISEYSVGNDTDFTISGWFNSINTLQGVIFDKSDGLTGYFARLQADGSLFFFLTQNGASFNITSTNSGLNDGDWHHFAFQVDRSGSELLIYIDGELDNSQLANNSSINLDNSEDFLVGVAAGASNSGVNTFFVGQIDDIKFNTRLLSDVEILSEYNNSVSAVGVTGSALEKNTHLALHGSAGDVNSTWSAVLSLIPGDFEFFLNEDTSNLFGDTDLDGQAEIGGMAIDIINAGIYYLEYIPAINDYTLSEITSVGFIGSARTGDESGWNDPDTDMTDIGNGVYILDNVSLFDGEWKIRTNDDWLTANWGDDSSKTGITDSDITLSFESDVPEFVSFGGNGQGVVSNPNQVGSNTSATVLEVFKGMDIESGTFFDIINPLKVGDASYIKLKVWSPQSDIPFRLKLEEIASNFSVFQEFEVQIPVANEWVELTFDLSADINNQIGIDGTYDRVVLFPGFGLTDIGTFYVDDIIYGYESADLYGANVSISAGDYNVKFDILNSTYTIAEILAPTYSMSMAEITTTEGVFTDTGGEAGNYADNEELVTTIYTGILGEGVVLEFIEFDVEYDYDFLYIYDGENVNSPLIGQYSGNVSEPASIIPGVVSATNVNGALTLRFVSDGGLTTSGWIANISTTSLPAPDVLAEYSLNDNSVAVDLSGNSINEGQLFSPAFVSDRFGNVDESYFLDGSSSYISIPNNWILSRGTTDDFTVSGWFKSNANGILFDKSDGFTGYLGWLRSDGTLQFFLTQESLGSVSAITSSTWNDDQWHFFVMMADRDLGLSIYVDNQLEAEVNSVSNTIDITTSESFLIGVAGESGNTNLNNFFNGSLDEFKIYSRLLSDEEIFEAYDRNGWFDQANLLSYISYSGNNLDEVITGVSGVADLGSYVPNRFQEINSAVSMNGLDQYSQFTTGSIGNSMSEKGSVSFWINPSNLDQTSKIIQFVDTNSNQKYLIEVESGGAGQILAYLHDGISLAPIVSNTALFVGSWTHVVITWDVTTDEFLLYTDGVLNTSSTLDSFVPFVGSSVDINYFHGIDFATNSSHYNGILDDVRLYKYALNEGQIDELYRVQGWPAQLVSNVAIRVDNGSEILDINLANDRGLGFVGWSRVLNLNTGDNVLFNVTGVDGNSFYGDADGADNIADLDASPITIGNSGNYYVSYDASTGAFLVYEITSIGVLGSVLTGDESGWLNGDINLVDDGEGTYRAQGIVFAADGEWKIRANDAWDLNWGDNEANGSFDLYGANIPALGGTYDLIVNLYTYSYQIVPALGVPIITSASPLSTSEIQLFWTDVENEIGYRIYRASDYELGNYEEIATLSANETSFIDASLSTDSYFLYYIEAFNNAITKSGGVRITATFSSNFETKAEYVTSFSNENSSYGRDIAVDDVGNYYTIGTFDGSIDIQGTNHAATNFGLFISKFDANNSLIWSISYDPFSTLIDGGDIFANAVDIAPDGTLYVTGSYRGELNGITSFESSSAVLEQNLYLLKLNSDGQLLDTFVLPSSGTGVGDDIAFDGLSNIYVSGQFSGDVTFAGTSLIDGGALLLRWSNLGVEEWAVYGKQTEFLGIGRGYGVAFDQASGTVYMTGRAYSSTDFSNDGSGIWAGNLTDFDIFLASYTSGGTFNWVSGISQGRTEIAYDVVLDNANDPIIGGYFNSSSLTLGVKTYSNPSESNEVLIVKYDQLGNVLESNVAASGLSEYALGMAVNNASVYLTGFTQPIPTDFGGTIVNNGELFVASFNSVNLETEWVEIVEGNAIGVGMDASNDKVYVAGRITNRVNIAGTELTTNGSDDAFFGIYNPNQIEPGLVGYYTFDNSSLSDFSGNGFDGVAINGENYGRDQYGYAQDAYVISNDGSYVQFEHNGAWNLSGAMSVSVWLRLNSYSDEDRDIIFDEDAFGNFGIGNSGQLALNWDFSGNSRTVVSENDVLPINIWSLVSISITENEELSIYVDGQPINLLYIEDSNGSIIQEGNVINVDRNQGVGSFAYIGSIVSGTFRSSPNISFDNLRIYAGTYLTNDEVLSQYESEISGGVDRLVAQYDFTSGELFDVSENVFDGEFFNVNSQPISPAVTTGLSGDISGALEFQDNGDFFKVIHDRSINLRRDFTVNFWVRPDQLSSSAFADVLFSDGALGRVMFDSNGQLFYHYPELGNPSNYPSRNEAGNSLKVNEWQMITYGIDNNDNLTMYHNGNLIISADVSDHAFSISSEFTASLNDFANDERYMDGSIDKLSVYQRILSSEEVSQLYLNTDERIVAYYPFNNDTRDYGPRGNDATGQDIFETDDRFGGSGTAYVFNGTSSQVSSNLNGHPLVEASFTYMAWINPAVSSQSASILSVGEDIDNARSSLFINGTQLAYIANNNDVTSSITIPANQWSHVAISKSATAIDFFLNGNFVETLFTQSGQNIQSTNATIGSTFGTREFFNGAIDEVRIFSLPLSGNEILSIYNEEAPISSIIAHYPLFQDANDISGNGFNGTTSGGAFYNGALVIRDNGTDRVSLPNEVMNGLNDFTVTAAVRFNTLHTEGSFPSNSILTGANSSTDNSLVFGVETGNQWLIGIDNNFQRISDPSIQAGVWYHVTFVRTGGDVSLYVDGEFLANIFVSDAQLSIEATGLIIGQEQDVLGGGFQQAQSLAGELVNLRVFGESLTTDQIFDISTEDKPEVLPPLAPTNIIARVIAPEAVRVQWQDNSDNETSFQVNYTRDVSNTSFLIVDSDITFVDIIGLENGVEYTFEVISINPNGQALGENSATATPVELDYPIQVNPGFPSLDDPITITVTIANLYPVGTLASAEKVYLHSGLIEPNNENMGGWTANADFGIDHGIGLMTNNGDGTWSITISDPRGYYGVNSSFVASQIGLLFRDANGIEVGTAAYNPDTQTGDMFIDLYDDDLYGKPSSAVVSLDGSGSLSLETYANALQIVGNSQFTIESWVNLNTLPSSGFFGIFRRELSSNVVPVDLSITSNTLRFSISNQNGLESSSISYPINSQFVDEWYHFVASYDGSELKLFVNGYLEAQTSSTIVLPTTEDATLDRLIIGQDMNGQLDDIRLWSFAKGQDEIRNELWFELSGTESGLSANWNFNNPTYDNGGLTFTPDITNSGNDLQFNGGVNVSQADLSVDIASSPNRVLIGGTGYTVTGNIFNTNQSELVVNQSVNLVLYLSNDASFDTSDRTLATSTLSINNLAVGASQSYSITFEVPTDITPSSSNLIVRIDDTEILDEVDESNNTDVVAIDVFAVFDAPTNLILDGASNTSFNFSFDASSSPAYEYEVATDEFFSNVIQTNVLVTSTNGTINNLNSGVQYWFGVRSIDESFRERDSELTVNSITTTNLVVDNTAPTIVLSAVAKAERSDQTVTVTVSDNIGVVYYDFFVRGAGADLGTEISTRIDFPAASTTIDVLQSQWDNLGVTFYAIAADEAGNTTVSDVHTIVADLAETETISINPGATGLDQSNYRIFSFPYETKSVIDVVIANSTDDWKIQRFNGSTNQDQSSLSAKNGYWFLARDNTVSMSFSNASPISIEGESIPMTLSSGWNQIGNPFLGTLNWFDVLNYNGLTNGEITTQISIYTGGFNDVSQLSRHQGGFVKSDVSRTIQIPISAASRLGGGNQSWVTENGGWDIGVNITAPNGYEFRLSGFGQFDQSNDEKDPFDLPTPILFEKYVRAEFSENESLSGQMIASSYHAMNQNDTWVMNVYSHFNDGTSMSLAFDNLPHLDNDEMLAMIDLQTGYSMELSAINSYDFNYSMGYAFKFIKGTPEFVKTQLILNQLVFSEIYPNPSEGVIGLSLNIPDFEEAFILRLELRDIMGRLVHTETYSLNSGYQELTMDLMEKGLSDGLYMLQINNSEKSAIFSEKITKKVYLKASN